MLAWPGSGPVTGPVARADRIATRPCVPHKSASSRSGSVSSIPPPGACHTAYGAAAAAAGVLLLRRAALNHRLPRPSRKRRCSSVSVSLQAAGKFKVVQPADEVLLDDIESLFAEAGGGKDAVSFDEAVRLEGVDGILEEEACTLQDLLQLWGDEKATKNFKQFSVWYSKVVALYDEFLGEDFLEDDEEEGAMQLPSDLMQEDMDDVQAKEYDDEDLLEDATASEDIDVILEKKAEAEEEALSRARGGADRITRVETTSELDRSNADITRLFKEGCDAENMLSFEAMTGISEIQEMLSEGDITQKEIQGMWDSLPQKGGSIDVLAFRGLMTQIDDLFQFDEEEEEEEEETDLAPPLREASVIKSELLELLRGYEEVENKPCGIAGTEDTDGAIHKLTQELEEVFRNDLDYELGMFDDRKLLGDWELTYSTSFKYRRWQAVLNGVNTMGNVNQVETDGLTQSFSYEADTNMREYQMEEVYIPKLKEGEEREIEEDEERGFRSSGAWSVGITNNVVTGEDDLVLKINVISLEYDDEEGAIKTIQDNKPLDQQMARTFHYSYLAYLDDEVRIMRTGLNGLPVFIFERLKEDA